MAHEALDALLLVAVAHHQNQDALGLLHRGDDDVGDVLVQVDRLGVGRLMVARLDGLVERLAQLLAELGAEEDLVRWPALLVGG